MRGQMQAESAELNIRGMDPALVEQVKIAAVRRGGRAALRAWVTQALARALRLEQEPAARPRLFLCAGCVAENRKRAESFQAPGGMGMMPMSTIATEITTGTPAVAAAPSSLARLLERVRGESESSSIHESLNVQVNDPGAAAVAGALTAAHAAPLPGDAAAGCEALTTTAISSPLRAGSSTGMENPHPSPSLPQAVEVTPGLWVGGDQDWIALEQWWDVAERPESWSVLSAAKEPWHRQMVGYKTSSAPEGPERLVARREGIPGLSGTHMTLNLIDVRTLGPGGTHYVPEEVIRAGLAFLSEQLGRGRQVLVHAGGGTSRAALFGLLWMQAQGMLPGSMPDAIAAFRKLYPRFEPGAGIRRYLETASVPKISADVSTATPSATAGQVLTDQEERA